MYLADNYIDIFIKKTGFSFLYLYYIYILYNTPQSDGAMPTFKFKHFNCNILSFFDRRLSWYFQ